MLLRPGMPDAALSLPAQLGWLLLLALPIASVVWTVTKEEIFREPREWCARRSETARTLAARKLFYLFTCEYCFSHWVGLGFVALTGFCLLIDDWRGYLLGYFAVVWMANVYMTLFAFLRQELKHETIEAQLDEKVLNGFAKGGPKKVVKRRAG